MEYKEKHKKRSSVFQSNEKASNWLVGTLKKVRDNSDLSKNQVMALVNDTFKGAKYD